MHSQTKSAAEMWLRGTKVSYIASIALGSLLSCPLRHLQFVIYLDKETLPPAFRTTLFCCFVRVFFSQNGCFQKLWSSNHKTNVQKTTSCLPITIRSLNTSGNTHISNRFPDPTVSIYISSIRNCNDYQNHVSCRESLDIEANSSLQMINTLSKFIFYSILLFSPLYLFSRFKTCCQELWPCWREWFAVKSLVSLTFPRCQQVYRHSG